MAATIILSDDHAGALVALLTAIAADDDWPLLHRQLATDLRGLVEAQWTAPPTLGAGDFDHEVPLVPELTPYDNACPRDVCCWELDGRSRTCTICGKVEHHP